MRVLVVEDDRETALFLQRSLKENGHVADIAGDGELGLALAREGGWDVMIVDRMLPKRDGLSIIRTIRNEGIATPALILSALSDVDERVKGLRAGGDDYLAKPYAFSELLARVEGLGRRFSLLVGLHEVDVTVWGANVPPATAVMVGVGGATEAAVRTGRHGVGIDAVSFNFSVGNLIRAQRAVSRLLRNPRPGVGIGARIHIDLALPRQQLAVPGHAGFDSDSRRVTRDRFKTLVDR